VVNKNILIAAVVVIVIVIGVGAYLATRPTGPAPGPATVPELTGNFETDVVKLGQYFEAQGISELTYTVWAAGDPNSVMRMYGIVEAANKINNIWEQNNINVHITVNTYWQDSFQRLYDEFLSAVPQGTNGDFFVDSYVYIANLAEEGYLLDISDYVNAYWSSTFNDFYTPLMEAAKYKGKYYGIPQDTEARPLYIREDVAACMGWDLTNLDEKVKNGEITWYDLFAKAREAVDKGCSKWGLVHRKGSAHPDLIQFIFAFGGRLYDEDTGKLVVDKEAIYKWFSVEYAFARDGLLPEDIMAWDWAQQIHPTIVGEYDSPTGNTLFDIGGTWYWTEWQTKSYYVDPNTGESRPLTPEEVNEKFYYVLFPAGEQGKQPVTLSQPFMWMIASNAGKDNPRYDELKEAYQKLAFLIVVGASDPEINAIHSIISAHVPVRKAATQLLVNEEWLNKLINMEIDLSQETKDAISEIVTKTANPINVGFLANVSYMLDYTKLAPSHPLYPKLADIFKEAIDKVIRGASTPEEALQYVIQKVQADPDLSENTLIVNEIPTGWEYP
jgi:inositol-phosphate transport system substrate-binding protein